MYYDAKLLLLKDIQFDLLSQDMDLNWLFSTQNLFILFLAKPISFFCELDHDDSIPTTTIKRP